MNELAKYQPQIPATMQRQINQRTANIRQIAEATKTAFDVNADVAQHCWITLMTSINQARFLLQAYQNSGYEDGEIIFQNWLKNFMATSNRFSDILGEKLQDVLESIPTDTEPPSFLEELANRLYQLFFGDLPPQETARDTLLRIGMDAKQLFTETAKTHVDRLGQYVQNINLGNGGLRNEPETK